MSEPLHVSEALAGALTDLSPGEPLEVAAFRAWYEQARPHLTAEWQAVCEAAIEAPPAAQDAYILAEIVEDARRAYREAACERLAADRAHPAPAAPQGQPKS